MFNFGNADKNMLGLKEEANKYQTDEYIVDINSKNDSHSVIAREIIKRKDKIKVLDIGCGSGVIGEFLEKYQNITLDGIEIDKKAIESLLKKNRYRKIISKSIEDLSLEELKRKLDKYDFIILADLLEHLKDPIATLEKLGKILNDNGNILVSIPNIAHIDIIEGLINNHFNYNLTGILDTTHLRFFTLKTFAEMIENMNKYSNNRYDLELIGSTHVLPVNTKMDSLIYKVLSQNNNVDKVQYIFRISLLKSGEESINLNKILKKKNKNIYRELEKKLHENTELREENNNLFKQNKKLFDDYSNLLNSNMDLTERYNNLKQNYEQLDQLVREMLESNSWKVTAPLRKLRSFKSTVRRK